MQNMCRNGMIIFGSDCCVWFLFILLWNWDQPGFYLFKVMICAELNLDVQWLKILSQQKLMKRILRIRNNKSAKDFKDNVDKMVLLLEIYTLPKPIQVEIKNMITDIELIVKILPQKFRFKWLHRHIIWDFFFFN